MRFALVAALCLVSACAGCERDRSWKRFDEWQQAAYQRMWGQPMPDKERGASRAIFDCMWDEVAAAGADPAAEVDCFIRGSNALLDCMDHSEHKDCSAQAAAVCTPSPAYTSSAKRCRKLHGKGSRAADPKPPPSR